MASSTELHVKANLDTVHIRLFKLSKGYVKRAERTGNPLFAKLTIIHLDHLENFSTSKGPLAKIRYTEIS